MVRYLLLHVALLHLCALLSAQISPYRYGACSMAGDRQAGVPGQSLFGLMQFRQLLNGPVEVRFNITGFNVNDEFRSHGLYIHKYGDISSPDQRSQFECLNAGPHFNPLGVNHGAADNDISNKHIGDLGTFTEDSNGVLEGRFFNDAISLHGIYSVLGHIFTVSVGPDDLGRGGDEQSLINGNGGLNAGCCIIGQSDDILFQFD